MKQAAEKSCAELLEIGRSVLESSGITDPGGESLRILAGTLCVPAVNLRAGFVCEVPSSAEEKYFDHIKKRIKGIPLQYIFRSACFMGLDFYVDENVLIPRSDTEVLVERCLRELGEESRSKRVLELGTGSGCVAVSLARLSGCLVDTVEISAAALRVAKKNARIHGVEKKINFIKGDMLDAGKIPGEGCCDLIVSNPPYVSECEYAALSEEVRKEPALALKAGKSGLKYIKFIFEEYIGFVRPGGKMLIEIGYSQKKMVENLAAGRKIEFIKDLNGIYRVAIVTRPHKTML